MKQGYIQIYTGNGKGKTTAALGISLRAVCAGKRVFFGQFIKGMEYSELKAPEYLPDFVIKQFGRGCFIENKAEEADIIAARAGLEVFNEVLKSGEYDLVVLDEVNVAIHFGLIETGEVLKVLKNRSPGVEVVLTGRYAPEELIEIADLVTEMREIKHYYKKGVKARTGIEK